MIKFVVDDKDFASLRECPGQFQWMLSSFDCAYWTQPLERLTGKGILVIEAEEDFRLWLWHGEPLPPLLKRYSPAMIAAIQQGQVFVVLNLSDIPFNILESGQIHTLEAHFQQFLPLEQVVIVTGNEFESQEAYQRYVPNGMMLFLPYHITFDYTHGECRADAHSDPHRISLDPEVLLHTKERSHRFVYLNANPYSYRTALIIKLFSRGILDRGLWSYVKPDGDPPDNRYDICEGAIDVWGGEEPLRDAAKQLCELGSVQLDDYLQGEWDYARIVYLTTKLYSDSYFSIVSETWFDVEGLLCVTEKLSRAFIQCHPFITLAQPGTLAFLRRRGFQTFSPWFDESYDEEPNHHRRHDMVVESIAKLAALSLDELHQLYHGPLKEIITHNFHHVMDHNTSQIKGVGLALEKLCH